ncbi:hypothetical protein H2248_012089 [Termitomyces sp. 'cryptogamus']|nr:hypothetical protein H2248_012089 [Termitomyces sp. 'cryptogamus']
MYSVLPLPQISNGAKSALGGVVTRILASTFGTSNRPTLPDPHAWYFLDSQDHLPKRLEIGDPVEVQVYILPLSPTALGSCQLRRLTVGTVRALVGDMACLELMDRERVQKLFLPLHLASASSN